MRFKAIIFNRSLVSVLCISFSLLSCSPKTALYHVGKKTDSELTIVEMSTPTAETIEHATLRHRSYLPSEAQNTWIESIDGQPVSTFIGKDKDSKTVKRYHLPPGKHEIALMYEGSGLSDRYIPMFEDSLRVTYSYQNRLRKPLILEVETSAGDLYLIKTHVPKGTCTISMIKNETVVAENVGTVRYWYSNVLHPENRHLNEHLMGD